MTQLPKERTDLVFYNAYIAVLCIVIQQIQLIGVVGEKNLVQNAITKRGQRIMITEIFDYIIISPIIELLILKFWIYC